MAQLKLDRMADEADALERIFLALEEKRQVEDDDVLVLTYKSIRFLRILEWDESMYTIDKKKYNPIECTTKNIENLF
jgi:hypothetical protein